MSPQALAASVAVGLLVVAIAAVLVLFAVALVRINRAVVRLGGEARRLAEASADVAPVLRGLHDAATHRVPT